MRFSVPLAASLVTLLTHVPSGARATYSIAAVDSDTREVGGAGASCVGSFVSIYSIYGSVPGRGVVHAQALLSTRNRDRAVDLMEKGLSPSEILAVMTDPAEDAQFDRRQWGIVDLSPSAVGFTGARTLDHASDVQGSVGSYTYAIQGNILTSAAVIDQARVAFEAEGCDLADRLMRALEAGGAGGEGDSRCTDRGIPSDGAYIEVDREGEPPGSYLTLRVDDTAPDNPLVLLRADFDAWRAEHPCPMPRDAGTAPPLDAGATDAGLTGRDASLALDSGMRPDTGAAALDASTGAPRDGGGCDCVAASSAGEPPGVAMGIALALVAARARRRRRV